MSLASGFAGRIVERTNSAQGLVVHVDAEARWPNFSEEAAAAAGLQVDVVTCTSLEEARKKQSACDFDVLLWSVSCRARAEEALEQLSLHNSPIPVIMVPSSTARGAELEQTLESGFRKSLICEYGFEDEVPFLCRIIQRIAAEREHVEKACYGPVSFNPSALWTALAEASPVAVIALNAKAEVGFWNAAAERIFGWTPAEVLGRTLPTIPAGSEQEFQVLLESQMHGIPHRGLDVVRRTKEEKLIALKLWTGPLRDVQGRINGKLAILADMSEAHQVRRENAELVSSERVAHEEARSLERFRELIEAAPDAIMEVDENGLILLMNASTEQMFGYNRRELLGQPVEVLVPSEHRKHHFSHRSNYHKHPIRRPMGTGLHLHGQRKDGSRFPVEISLSPVKSADGFRVSAVIRDVTDRQRAEDQFRELQTRLTAELSSANRELELRSLEAERANRLKSEFLASISHELRTPLHTIIGFSELLAEKLEGPLNDKQARFVNHIHNDSLHLLELINGILDLSKIEAGKLDLHLEVFDADAALKEAITGVTPVARAKEITITLNACPKLMVRADPLRFKQILLNLLSNAMKFTPDYGTVGVECTASDGFARFCVSDTGFGIPEHEQEAIFDKFHQAGSTTNGVREGTGLGLAITKHLVQSHGGRIWVESAPGCGSRFSFTLPLL